MRLRSLAALAALPVAATAAGAQTWRTLDVSRQVHDTAAIAAHIAYAAGKLELKPASSGALYRATMRYDAQRAEAVASFDASSRALDLGVRLRSMQGPGGSGQDAAGSMQAELAPSVPVDLSLELGAVEANLQLGGLRLTDLSLRCGAADVTARFDKANRENLRSMTLQVGAADVKLADAANSGVSRIVAEVGAGSLSLDFGGALAHDVDVTATLALGGLTINVAPDDGVFVDERTVLVSFQKDGFTKRADGWYSDNYDKATRHVRVHLHAFLGGFKLTRVER